MQRCGYPILREESRPQDLATNTLTDNFMVVLWDKRGISYCELASIDVLLVNFDRSEEGFGFLGVITLKYDNIIVSTEHVANRRFVTSM